MSDKKKKHSNTLMATAPAMWAGGSDYRREDDHRTVTKAGEIMRDKDRMKGVREQHKKINKDMEKACK